MSASGQETPTCAVSFISRTSVARPAPIEIREVSIPAGTDVELEQNAANDEPV